MRYILILILFCSCSTMKFTVNGQQVKQRTKPVNSREVPILIGAFLVGYATDKSTSYL